VCPVEAKEGVEVVLGEALHADEQAAALTFAARPALDSGVELLPSTEVEVADAEVRAVGDFQGFAQGVAEVLLDVVEDARHGGKPSRAHASGGLKARGVGVVFGEGATC